MHRRAAFASSTPRLLLLAVASACTSPDADVFEADAGLDAGPDGGAPLDYDCENLPEGPFVGTQLPGPTATEDLAFDDAGNLFGMSYRGPGIFRSRLDEPPVVFAPGFTLVAGLRFHESGRLIAADPTNGILYSIDRKGVASVLVSGLTYPNGITMGMDGLVYYSEHGGDRVRRVDPETGFDEVIVEPGTVIHPNGLSFSPNYRTLYVAEYEASHRIWAIPIAEDGTPGVPEVFATIENETLGLGLDGLAVDACGNVYASDYGGFFYRIRADGSDMRVVFNEDGAIYIPNMDWGTDIDGWDPMSLYIPHTDVTEPGLLVIPLGVPSKPRPLL